MPRFKDWHMSARDKAVVENIIREEMRAADLSEAEIKKMMSEEALRKRVRAAAQEIKSQREEAEKDSSQDEEVCTAA